MMADGLTLEQTAERFGRHPQSIRKRLAAGDFPSATKDRRGRWRLDPAEVAAVTEWQPVTDPVATAPAGSPNALQLLDQLAPLLQRVADAERERADAETRARIAEHEAAQLAARLDELQTAAHPLAGSWPALVAALVVAVAVVAAAVIVAGS